MSFDRKCLDLAEHFLPTAAPERLTAPLAQAIQDAVEGWLESEIIERTMQLRCDHFEGWRRCELGEGHDGEHQVQK